MFHEDRPASQHVHGQQMLIGHPDNFMGSNLVYSLGKTRIHLCYKEKKTINVNFCSFLNILKRKLFQVNPIPDRRGGREEMN